FRVAREDFARERHAGGFAAAGEQVFTELRQAFRALLGDAAPVARAVDERAAALGNRLQHVAEGGGAHGGLNLSRHGIIDRVPVTNSQTMPDRGEGSLWTGRGLPGHRSACFSPTEGAVRPR